MLYRQLYVSCAYSQVAVYSRSAYHQRPRATATNNVWARRYRTGRDWMLLFPVVRRRVRRVHVYMYLCLVLGYM